MFLLLYEGLVKLGHAVSSFQMDVQTDSWTDGRTDGQMGGQTDRHSTVKRLGDQRPTFGYLLY